MVASRVPETLARLEAIANANVSSALVFRGPFVTGDPGLALFIGYDGDPNGDFRSVTTDTEWAGLGAKQREERFEVEAAITAIRGDGDVVAATVAVYAALTQFEAALRADPSLEIGAPLFVAELVGGDLWTMPHPTGLQVRLYFRVRVRTRI